MTTTWIDRPPPRRRRESRLAAWTWQHTKILHRWSTVSTILIITAAVFALTRIKWDAPGMPSLGSATLPWVGWLLVIPAWVFGALNRGRVHAKGIRHSHFHAIKGKALATVLLLIAIVLIAGGG